MTRSATFPDNVLIGGTLTIASAGGLALPAGTITNAMIASAAAITASKLARHQNVPAYLTGAAVDSTILAYRCSAAGTIINFWAGCTTIPTGTATVTVDLKKNGTTVLSAIITLNSANTILVAVQGTVSVTTVAANDLLEVVLDETTLGTETTATGVFASIGIDEAYPI